MLFTQKEKISQLLPAVIDWLLIGLVFLLPLCFALFYEISNVFILYKTAALRVLVSFALLVLVGKLFWNGRLEYRFNKIIFWLIGLLALVWSVAAIFSPWQSVSLVGSYERQQGLLTMVFYLLFFLILILQLEGFFQLKRYLGAILLSSFFVCFYGFAQVLNFDPVKWGESFLTNGRIFSTLGQPDFLGHFLIIVIPLTAYVAIFLTKRWLVRILLAVLLFGQFFCLFFSYSRSAWLALAAEIFLAIILFCLIKGRKKMAISLLAISLVAAILGGAWLTNLAAGKIQGASLAERLVGAFDLRHGSVKVRLNIWQAAIDEFRHESWPRRLVGYGPDALSEVFVRHYQSTWALDEAVNTWPDRAHDSILDIVLSFGLLGLIAYLIFFGYFLTRLIIFLNKAPRNEEFWLGFFCLLALVGYFVNNLFSFSDTPQYLYLFLILGVVTFLFSHLEPGREIRLRLTKFSRAVIFVFILIIAAIFLFEYNWQPIKADNFFMAAIKRSDDCSLMLSDTKAAIGSGGQYHLFYVRQYINISLNCFDQLLNAEEKSKVKDNLLWCLSLSPAGTDYYFDRARVDAEAKLAESFDRTDAASAEKDFAALARSYPAIPAVYEDWASFAEAQGNYDEAIAIISRGTGTLPLAQIAAGDFAYQQAGINSQLVRFDDLLGTAYLRKNLAAEALVYWLRILRLDPHQLPVYKKIADIYYQMGDRQKALWYNERGFALNPTDYVWPFSLGLLEEEMGDWKAAAGYYELALKIAPADQLKDIQIRLNELQK